MPTRRFPLWSVPLGGLLALVGAFPAAALVALFYHFPIPFGEMSSGPDAVIPSLFAVLFYGVVGGFPLLAVLGALVGLLVCFIGRQDGQKTFRLTLVFTLLVDLLAALTLAVLDKIIGPW